MIDEFKAEVVATGSSGNFTVLNGIIALDLGVPFKTVRPYSKNLMLCFIGHEHSDHLKKSTVKALANERPSVRFTVGEWLVPILLECGVMARSIDVIQENKVYDYGLFQISPVSLHHNVRCFGLKIFWGGRKALYAVDTGHMEGVTAKDYDLYMIENNHTEDDIRERIERKMEKGEYSYEISAAFNHLSEEMAIEWLAENAGPHSKVLFLHQHRDKER